MSEKTEKAIAEREQRTRGEKVTYRQVQAKAKDMGIPATGAREDMEKAIAEGESESEGSA